MSGFMKFLTGIGITLAAAIFGALPEGALFLIWHLVSPTSELGRILLGTVLTYFGIGISILFGIVALCFWLTMMVALLDS